MKRDDTKKSFVHALCVLFFIGCVSFFVWQIGTGYTNWLDTSKTFDIQKIEIEGNDLLPEEDILKLAGITPAMSIWDVDLEKSEKKIGHNAFVTSVQLERFFPDRLYISIQEKLPIALINYKSRLFCIDREGLVLPSRPGKLYGLPVLSGQFKGELIVGTFAGGHRLQQGLHLLKLILNDRPFLYNQISEIRMDSHTGYVLYTKTGGVPVRIGQHDLRLKLRCLEAILNHLIQKNTLKGSRYIDLRFRNQVIVGDEV